VAQRVSKVAGLIIGCQREPGPGCVRGGLPLIYLDLRICPRYDTTASLLRHDRQLLQATLGITGMASKYVSALSSVETLATYASDDSKDFVSALYRIDHIRVLDQKG
jgi:hypothetical protein